MRKKLLALCFIILTYGVFLVATLPVNVVLSYVKLPKNVQVQQVTGSVWQGQAASIKVNNIVITDVNWDVELMPLLTGSAEVAVQFGRSKRSLRGDGIIGYSSEGAFVQDLTVRTNTEWLLDAADLVLPVTTQGDVKLTIKQAMQGTPWCGVLDGQLSWTGASVDSLLGNVEIGTANAKLSCEKGGIVADIKQNSSHLRFSGKAQLLERGRYTASGVLVPGNELPRSLRSNLGYIGKVNSNGEYKLTYSGRL